MNWYKQAQSNKEIMSHPDFKGFHCQRGEGHSGDMILKEYAQSYFFEIIESISYDLQDKMRQQGIELYSPEDQYSDEFEEWADNVETFLWENGIRWIFVSHDQLFNDDRKGLGSSYGNLCYYILIPNNAILYEFPDVHEENASAIVYDSRVANPTRIPIEEEEDELV